MPNRLSQESSPYLLHHANNPVDWYPWSEEALTKAKSENKPIFLSIGYSACHWCHVMERESFENERTATLMNQLYINIKVDREERPDLDSIYMDAVVAMSGQGGWPMSVFLTPEGLPFYGGTYFPPTPRYGVPSFEQILQSVAKVYHTQKEDINTNIEGLLKQVQTTLPFPMQNESSLDATISERAVEVLALNFDKLHGGFGDAPKFPQPMICDFLLRHYYRTHKENMKDGGLDMVELTLQKMACGGIYDQLRGGFHRYSVDNQWLTPHFEKMLYDNALLARLYLHAYQLTDQPFYRRIVEETLDYVAREMTDPSGGFYSSQDADSEGEEGKFFLWTQAEIEAILTLEGESHLFCTVYGVQPNGNFEGEGKNILNIPVSLDQIAQTLNLSLEALTEILNRSKARLFVEREKRIKPTRDEKIITAWNGLMLAAFAEAGRVLGREDYINIAIRNAEFVLAVMKKEGRLLRTWKADLAEAKLMAYLEDYAFYADGLLALYQTTFNPRWFQEARYLMEMVLEHFTDVENGGFFDTANDHEQLINRPKNLQDNATPCGNSMAIRTLLLLTAFTGQTAAQTAATCTPESMRILVGLQELMSQYPAAFSHWLGSLEFAIARPKEIALIGQSDSPETKAMLQTLFVPYRPNQVVALADGVNTVCHPELVHHRPGQAGQTVANVCQNSICQQPVTTVAELERLL